MADKTDEASLDPTQEDQRDEFSDFTLVLKNGQEIKCHKIILSKVSPFFSAMLRQDCAETRTNKMEVTEFEPDTVKSFVDFLYGILDMIPVGDLYWKEFDEKKLTPELLRLSHMYQVKDLEDKCIQYLMKTIEDSVAVDIWSAAETIGNEDLKKVALNHFGKKSSGQLLQVPGLEESFQSLQLVKSLVTYLAQPKPPVTIGIQVHCINAKRNMTQKVSIAKGNVKVTDTVRTLRLLISEALIRTEFRCKRGSLRKKISEDPLVESRTLQSYNLEDEEKLVCYIVKCGKEA